jgi:hypothetical protein
MHVKASKLTIARTAVAYGWTAVNWTSSSSGRWPRQPQRRGPECSQEINPDLEVAKTTGTGQGTILKSGAGF